MNLAGLTINPPQLAIQSAKSFVLRIATGVTAELVPAPPAGYVTLLFGTRVINEHATLALDWSIQDALGLLFAGRGTSALPAFGAGPNPTAASNTLTSSFLTVGGAGGTPAVFIGSYVYLPIATAVKTWFCSLTTSFQSVDASCVPPAGQIALAFPQLLLNGAAASLSNTGAAIMNDDTATAQVIFKHTRGSVVTQLMAQASARSKGQVGGHLFPLENADNLEAKLVGAPGIAGAVTLRFWYTFAPLTA